WTRRRLSSRTSSDWSRVAAPVRGAKDLTEGTLPLLGLLCGDQKRVRVCPASLGGLHQVRGNDACLSKTSRSPQSRRRKETTMSQASVTADRPATSYDEVPYESYPFSQTHPDRLATVATLFGMRPAPVDRCRVLELGCAAGGNLIPMALALP